MAGKKPAQEQTKDQTDQVNQAADTPAEGPAPAPGAGGSSDGSGISPVDGASVAAPQAPAAGSAQEGTAPITASVSSEGAAGTGAETTAADQELEKRPYLVTGIIDVRHDGELYTKGQTLWLEQDSATALLNKRYITVKEGNQ